MTVNWANQPGIMVDHFSVTLHGMFVFSGDSAIAFKERSFSCAAGGEYCANTQFVSQGVKDWGGMAMNRVILREPAGIDPQFIYFEASEVASTGGQNVTFTCGLGGAASVECGARLVAIMGAPGMVEPFQLENSPAHTGPTNAGVGFSVPTGKIAAMNCGVRKAYVQPAGVVVPRKYSSLWFGQLSTDCGWDLVDLYGGVWLFGWENPYATPLDYSQVNRADGTRLP